MKPVNPFDPLGQNNDPENDVSSLLLVAVLITSIIGLAIIWTCTLTPAGA
jgi:hypothetical protein